MISSFGNGRVVVACVWVLVMLGALITPATALEVYVAVTGDDANPGTAKRPVVTLQRARDMLRDPGGAWGPEMQQDMERLRERMNEMAGSMNEGLAILERLRDRISQG